MKKNMKVISTALLLVLLAAACAAANGNGDGELTASGTITAKTVNVAAEVSGRVSAVHAVEGSEVVKGDILFTIDAELYQAQVDQAQASVDTAAASLETSLAQLKSAQLQYKLAQQGARLQYGEALAAEWRRTQPGDFDLPAWYFTRDEAIAAANALVDEKSRLLEEKTDGLEDVLVEIANQEFIDLEKELAAARATYLVADAAVDATKRASENTEIVDAAEDALEIAENELENVRARYDQELDTNAADEVLQARGELGAAQAAYDEAINLLMGYFIGDDSLQVQAASAGVVLAETQVTTAEASLAQAETALEMAVIQVDKTAVRAPISGTILTLNLEEGELTGAGSTAMTIGNMDEVQLTVYIPEDQYGRVKLDQEVVISVDSFPEKSYNGTVIAIADQAEFTPSNVQTVEGRKSTVFAVKIIIPNPTQDLKAGMPADVRFLFE